MVLPIFYLLTDISFSWPFNCKQSKQPIALIDKKISQSFIASSDNISAILLKPATYTKIINSKIVFAIRNASGKLIYATEKTTLLVEDNKLYQLKIPKNTLSKDGVYSLEISYSRVPKTPIGFWTTADNCYTGDLYLEEEKKCGI